LAAINDSNSCSLWALLLIVPISIAKAPSFSV
jgi:hypothetical protein